METTTLQAEVRTTCGKGPARRLRASGKVPGVFYGPGADPTPLTLSPGELTKGLRSERGRNAVFTLKVDGKDELAIVKDVATDPLTRQLLHVDLYRVFEDQELDVKVPLRTVGKAIGVVQGGVLNVTRRVLPLQAKPGDIPVAIEVDVTSLNLKQTISVKDLDLPTGVICTLPSELTLVLVLEARTVAEEVTEEAALAASEGEPAPTAAQADAADQSGEAKSED